MIAMSISNRTIYDSNLFQLGLNMIAISKFVLKSHDESRDNKLSIIEIIFGPNWERLQSYMVRFGIDIAIIFGPLSNEDCIHIWSKF